MEQLEAGNELYPTKCLNCGKQILLPTYKVKNTLFRYERMCNDKCTQEFFRK